MYATTSVWSEEDARSFVNEYYDAWSGTDEDLIMSYYTDDVVLQIPNALMEGNRAVREQFVRPFITAFPGNHHVIKNMIFGSDSVVVEWSFEAQHTGPFEGHAASGARVKVPGSGVYEYDTAQRKITSGRIYFDVGTLLQTITEVPVSDPNKAAEALQLNEHNLGVIINTIPTFAWTTRPDGYCDFLNQRWLDYAGMTSAQAEGWGWIEAILPDDREHLVEIWQSALASGSPVEAEARMRRYDGSYRWFLFRANAVRDQSGKIIKWYGTNVDIEDRRRAEQALLASELSWRQIVDNIPGLVATMGASGEVEFLNRQTLEYFGKTNEDLKNWSMIGVVHPDDLPRVIAVRTQSIETGQIYEIEHRCLGADGVYRWFQVRGLPVRNEEGAITRWYLLLTDIEDLKKAEEALHLSEQNLGLTINTIPTLIQVSRPDGSVISVNQAVLDYHAITLQELQKEDFRDRFYHPDDVKRLREWRKESLTKPRQFEYEQRAMGKDGKYRWFLVRYNPLLNEQGAIVRWYATAVDIEDRKQAEAEIQRSEAKHRQVIDAIPALAWCNLPDGPNEFLSKPWHEYTGLTVDESKGWGWQVAFHPDDLPPLMEKWMRMLVSGDPDEVEARLRRHDGIYRWFLIRAEPFRDESGKIVRWYGTSTDIHDRKLAEEKLRRSETSLAEGQRLSRTGSFSWRVETGEITWSEEVYRIFDFEPGIPVTLELIGSRIHPEDQDTLHDMIERVRSAANDFEYEHRLLMPNGSVKYLHLIAHGMLNGDGQLEFIGALQDVTENRRAQEALTTARSELAHMSRVTMLSALTASIAHEINQPIAAVITSAGACLRWLNRDTPEIQRARDAAMRIEEDGKRASEIITNLRAFYRKDVAPNREMVSLNDIVGEMLKLLRSESDRHSVVMRTELASDLRPVSADPVQLRQVLMNLMLNGMEAMSEFGGELNIRTGHEDLGIKLSVIDSGVGIPPDKVEQIFEEFFTTKAEGTGMGLAISRTIIESHGGRLWATTNPDGGSGFHFTIPIQSEGAR